MAARKKARLKRLGAARRSVKTLNESLDFLQSLASTQKVLPELAQSLGERPKFAWKDGSYLSKHVALSKALYGAGRLSFDEYVHHSTLLLHHYHDESDLAKSDPILAGVNERLSQVEREHGLGVDEYWTRGSEPEEYQKLQTVWEERDRELLYRTFKDFGIDDVAELFRTDQERYYRSMERGRRAFHNKTETESAVRDFIDQHIHEAEESASNGAYTAAIHLVGAATEGLLLLRCLQSKRKALAVARMLPRSSRPSNLATPLRWTFENLIAVCSSANWLPKITHQDGVFIPEGLAHRLRSMRNNLHAGRQCIDRPWFKAHEMDYRIAKSIYQLIAASITKSPQRTA